MKKLKRKLTWAHNGRIILAQRLIARLNPTTFVLTWTIIEGLFMGFALMLWFVVMWTSMATIGGFDIFANITGLGITLSEFIFSAILACMLIGCPLGFFNARYWLRNRL